ncbi:hypothetical protein OsI_35847 [Oryza sativa Indica Group]|uniref:WW domain-containing protein n=2 Tax=Oryza TaxID=4527 RepID=A0A0E0J0Y6_ORYNI|nr:hypothetical protein OsI_35847 [Oryza sativa Indica Group]
MEVQPELSLGPTLLGFGVGAGASKSSSSSESDGSSDDGSRKRRKHFAWEEAVSHASLDLHLNDPLPMDWEQCLDLHSGRMYYLNRKTMRKSWVRPMEEHGGSNTLDLELNISTVPSTFHVGASKASSGGAAAIAEDDARIAGGGSGVGSLGPMVAVPCVNCHLLVMLCKSSPACPNCKFVQPSVPAPAMPRTPPRRRLEATVKPLETLSLLH